MQCPFDSRCIRFDSIRLDLNRFKVYSIRFEHMCIRFECYFNGKAIGKRRVEVHEYVMTFMEPNSNRVESNRIESFAPQLHSTGFVSNVTFIELEKSNRIVLNLEFRIFVEKVKFIVNNACTHFFNIFVIEDFFFMEQLREGEKQQRTYNIFFFCFMSG